MPINANTLKKYLNPVFIETGSGLGDGIQAAIEAEFNEIWSVDSSYESFNHCANRFKWVDMVFMIHNDSISGLKEILLSGAVQCTFWLDAHNENDYPVLAEIEQIAKHSIKTHTILIDDLRMFPEDKNGLTVDQIKAKILEINPKYEFSYEDGHVKNDILVAKVPQDV